MEARTDTEFWRNLSVFAIDDPGAEQLLSNGENLCLLFERPLPLRPKKGEPEEKRRRTCGRVGGGCGGS